MTDRSERSLQQILVILIVVVLSVWGLSYYNDHRSKGFSDPPDFSNFSKNFAEGANKR